VIQNNRKCFDFSCGGILIVLPVQWRARQKGYEITYENTAYIPLHGFLPAFSHPVEMAKRLKKKGFRLIARWKKLNEAPTMCGRRVSVETAFTFHRYSWIRNGKREESAFDICLNTFGFTKKNDRRPSVAAMKLQHIKVQFFKSLLATPNFFNFIYK
jgi:hypothetical protein